MIYTLRFFGGRQPLCGMGVTSEIDKTLIPAASIARIAASLPEPGPFTNTVTDLRPQSYASFAASVAAI
jgi:hypothetical protein